MKDRIKAKKAAKKAKKLEKRRKIFASVASRFQVLTVPWKALRRSKQNGMSRECNILTTRSFKKQCSTCFV